MKRNVTARKRAEEQLQISEKQYRLLFSEMVGSFALHEIICDENGKPCDYRFLQVNPAFETLTGLSAKDVIGKTVSEVLPKTESFWIERYGKVALTGKSAHFEEYSSELDRYYEVIAYCPEEGKFATVFSDITERHQAERTLRENENKYRMLLENIPQRVFLKDRDSVYISCNENYARDLGISPEEIAGKTDYDFYPNELAEKHRTSDKRIVDSGETEDCEESHDHQGREIVVHMVKTPVKDEQGNIIGVLGVFGDITERKKAQEQIQAEDNKLRGILDSMIDGVTITDMSGKITSINSATTEQVGYSEQEVIGKTLGEVFIAEQDMPKFRQAVKTLATGQAIRDQEFLCRGKNGTTFPMGLNLSVLKDDQGKPTAIIVDHRDITERKKAEEKLRATNQQLITSEQQLTAANQQLQASIAEREETEESLRQAKEQAEHAEAKVRQINKQLEASIEQANLMAEQAMSADMTKSEFLANMSHEIRTPMTAIMGYADLLTDVTLSSKERAEHLAIIRRNGENLLALINDILDLSKIEARKLTIELRPYSLPSIIAEITSLMMVRAEQQGISLSAEYTGSLPETILVDDARLRQALVNLVGNAIKFTEHGFVRIVVTFLSNWRDEKPAVKIQVVDSGIGINEEALLQLFEPFVQADASTSRKYGGTGLGLTITHHIAELLQGELTAESTPGEGSVFTLMIPTGPLEGIRMLQEPSEAMYRVAKDSEAKPVAKDSLAGKRILLAEDGPDNQRLISTVLRKAGAEVTLAENGREAVERVMADSYDVILMDMQMPEMDGYEATEQLRAKGFSVPIIALTAHALTGDRDLCLQAGCTDYQSKPIDRSQLIATIVKHTSSKAAKEAEATAEPPRQTAETIQSSFADDPDLAEIIDIFVTELPKKLAAMREALANQHHKELQRLAHQLKGAGGSYGYPSLTEAAKTLEEAAKAQDVEVAALALSQMANLCQAIVVGRGASTVLEELES